MKKQIKLSQGGKLYLANITIDETTGQVVNSSIKQVTFPEKSSLTFSVLLDNETKARYAVSLDGGSLTVEKKANKEKSWLRGFVSYTAKNVNLCHSVFTELLEIDKELQDNLSSLDNSLSQEVLDNLSIQFETSACKQRTRAVKVLQDAIDKHNIKSGSINTIEDFLEGYYTYQV